MLAISLVSTNESDFSASEGRAQFCILCFKFLAFDSSSDLLSFIVPVDHGDGIVFLHLRFVSLLFVSPSPSPMSSNFQSPLRSSSAEKKGKVLKFCSPQGSCGRRRPLFLAMQARLLVGNCLQPCAF